MSDLKSLGYSRLKVDDKGAIQFPKKETSHIKIMGDLETKGWKSANREGALNRGNSVGYMTKGSHGIEVSSGSTQWKQGASIHPWKPAEEAASGTFAETMR